MTSLQEYFEYIGQILCGIPKVEMLGEESDWMRLVEKVQNLRDFLSPISHHLSGHKYWWLKVEEVAKKLLDTYRNQPDVDWWRKIITKQISCGGPSEFDGWFVRDFLGTRPSKLPSGLVSVPMTIRAPSGYEEQSALVAGILGFTLKESNNNLMSIQAFHGWNMLLESNFTFRHS